uniref:Parathyroid hormone n=1 Tax=Denticeps clupeoides TaxID=299321 RepID=A0AAY4DU48_9TELE
MANFAFHRLSQCFLPEDGRRTRRSLSEVQLMHNVGEHKYVQERQDWLQTKLRDIHTAPHRNAESGAVQGRAETPRSEARREAPTW